MEITSRSQLEQDVYVVKLFGQKRNGYFLDFGAFDGISFSNTYVLEKDFGWTGICVEPLPSEFEKLRECRSAYCCNKALYAKSGETLEFVVSDMLSGIKDSIDYHTHVKNSETIKVQTITPTDLLIAANAPTEIDYMSLDTEGSELTILEAFDFDRYTVKFINVEHNYQEPRRSQMRNLLESNGFIYYGSVKFDDNYIHFSFFTDMRNTEYTFEYISSKLWLSSSNIERHEIEILYDTSSDALIIPYIFSKVLGQGTIDHGILKFSPTHTTYERKQKICIQNVYIPESPFWGLGDYLRGSLSLAGICESLGLSFELNYSQHPIYAHLVNKHSNMHSVNLSDVPIFHMEDVNKLLNALKEITSTQLQNNIVIPVTTNCWHLENGISNETREIIRKSMTPNSELEITVKEIQSILASNEYNVVHIRMGDKYLLDNQQNEKIYYTFYTMILSSLPRDIPYMLFSDDNNFKEYCKKRGIMVSPTQPCHLSDSVESISEKVKGTLSDFFCMSQAKTIYKYSNHVYGSGFLDWCADIYGVPTVELLLPAPTGANAYISDTTSDVVSFTIDKNAFKHMHGMFFIKGQCHVNGKFFPYEFMFDYSLKSVIFPNTHIKPVYNEKAAIFKKVYSYLNYNYDKLTTLPMIDTIDILELVEYVMRSEKLFHTTLHIWIVEPYDRMPEFKWPILPIHATNIKERVHFLSFASMPFALTLRRLQHHAESCELFASVNAWTEQDIPDFIEKCTTFLKENPRLFGYGTWKPYIIHTMLEKIPEGDFLFYSDAGNSINPIALKRFIEYLEMCEKSPYKNVSMHLESESNGRFQEKNWTKEDVLDYFSLTEEQRSSPQICGGFWLLQKCDFTTNLVKKWLELVEKYSMWDDSPSTLPNADTFYEHRHCQSMLSCLLKTHGTHTIEKNEFDVGEDSWNYPIWATRIR